MNEANSTTIDEKPGIGKTLLSNVKGRMSFLGSFKNVMLIAILAGAGYWFFFGGSAMDQTGFMRDTTYQMHLTDVNARFSRSFYFFGTPELIITSSQLDATIDADGYITAEIKDGVLEGDLNGQVIWSPQLRKDVAQEYTITGSGWSGIIDVGVDDGEAFIKYAKFAIDIQAWTE